MTFLKKINNDIKSMGLRMMKEKYYTALQKEKLLMVSQLHLAYRFLIQSHSPLCS